MTIQFNQHLSKTLLDCRQNTFIRQFAGACFLGDNCPVQGSLREKRLRTQICAKDVLSHASSWTETVTPGGFKACINQNNFCTDPSVRRLLSQVCQPLSSSTSTKPERAVFPFIFFFLTNPTLYNLESSVLSWISVIHFKVALMNNYRHMVYVTMLSNISRVLNSFSVYEHVYVTRGTKPRRPLAMWVWKPEGGGRQKEPGTA